MTSSALGIHLGTVEVTNLPSVQGLAPFDEGLARLADGASGTVNFPTVGGGSQAVVNGSVGVGNPAGNINFISPLLNGKHVCLYGQISAVSARTVGFFEVLFGMTASASADVYSSGIRFLFDQSSGVIGFAHHFTTLAPMIKVGIVLYSEGETTVPGIEMRYALHH